LRWLILLSAVSAVVVNRWYLGDQPLFRVPPLGSVQPADMLVYAAIGVISGLGAVAYVRLLLWLKRHGDRWTSHAARIVLPGLAGLCVGIVGFWLPQVEGPGYLTIDSALHGRFAWSQLLLLALAKTGVTTLCFASGTPGVVGRHARDEVIGILTLEDVARAFRIERRAHSGRDGPFWPPARGITAAREDRQSD
jgi:H+/Cl- antiporter ClcA